MTKSISSISIRHSLLFFIFLIASCGGGGGGSTTTYPIEPGIYTGTFTPSGGTSEQLKVIVTSAKTWAGFNGTEATVGTVGSSTLSDAFGFSATMTSTTSGTYNSSGVTGTFSITDAGLYNRSSNLSKLVGTWVDAVNTDTTGTTTWTIDSGGNISMTSVSGCTATGTVTTLDTNKNEYSLSVAVSNCSPFNDTFSGYCYTSDHSFTDDKLNCAIISSEAWGVYEPIKQ